MFTAAYNSYYWEETELAKQQLAFFQAKLDRVNAEACNDTNRGIRKRRLELILYCIKYTYGL